MNYRIYSFRHADVILQQPEFITEFNEIISVLENITEDNIIQQHNSYGDPDIMKMPKSISVAINQLFKERFRELNWNGESAIFGNPNYQDNRWRLDFAKGLISVEVAFNHSGSIAWNLIKPVLASELNHIEKAIQTKIGVIITATSEMRIAGGFDGAIGTFETFEAYLKPFNNILTVPLLIIGLERPATFKINHIKPAARKTIGEVFMLNSENS